MDWMELWFGLSPDNGDGSFELLVVVSLLIVGASWLLRSKGAARALSRQDDRDPALVPCVERRR